jgi:hypothetical protein
MEGPDDEDDFKLVKASAGLLSDLEAALPKLLWKASKNTSDARRVHTEVKQRDLDYSIRLVYLSHESMQKRKLMHQHRLNLFKANRNCLTQD